MTSRTKKHRGIALVTALLFVAVFAALSVGMFSLSRQNMWAAANLHTANRARSSAESGLEVLRYYVSKIAMLGTISESERFATVVQALTGSSTVLPSGFACSVNDDGTVVSFGNADSPIALTGDQGFYADMTADGTNGVNVLITGSAGSLERSIRGSFTYGVEEHTAFDYGVASKGPVSLAGNILLSGVNISVESDVYIESMAYNNALNIQGSSQIAGDVKIVNPDGYVTLKGGQAGIGGETGAAAIQNHVQVGVDQTDFPYPDTAHFEQYVNGDTITQSSVSGGTYENVRIAAGTNPTFSGNVVLKGIIYVESPNQVNFSGNVDVTGIIVGEGSVTDNSCSNQINFAGNVNSQSVATKDASGNYILADPKFNGVQAETGTFLMAPGFKASFGGNFGTLNGCIAANGIEFYGNAGGIIGGSVVNYSPNPMVLSGNSDLLFNRSGIVDVPSGFVPEIVVRYNAAGYEEPVI
ncbi:MAG: hypothetical protein LLF76_10160 [Planctomycetaceae bacterium]|nr:hypothetical protein [Planctomycetaceae bacterium]